MEFDKQPNRVKKVKTGLQMNFNVTSGRLVNRAGYYTAPA